MDAYEATRIVFSRLQGLDPENAHRIMGLLLLQEHGEKEVIRLAFGPDSLLHSLILKARKELGLALPSTSGRSPLGGGGSCGASPFLRQNSASYLPPGELPSPLAANSPSSWAAPRSVFSRSNSAKCGFSGSLEELQNSDELLNPSTHNTSHFCGGGGDLTDEFHLADQLSFRGGPVPAPNCNHPLSIASTPGDGIDVLHPEIEYNSSNSIGDGPLFPCGTGWGINGYHHRRSSSAAADLCHGDYALEPCHYFARGYCKNGTACRFLHGLTEEALTVGTKMDSVSEKQYEELQLRSRSLRMGSASQFMVSAFPCSPTASVRPPPLLPLSKNLSLLLQLQQNESQRAADTTAALSLGADDALKLMGRSRSDLLGNPSSRQIYLTFPADSTFREEDVSNYFSIYGPVQDVRIPYQQKRMFGFVTFLYPETVKLILSKGNPHFVCDSRVLVKPYKEKGKIPDKIRKLQQSESGDFSGCSSPTALDAREAYDLNQLGARMLYNTYNQELLLRRKLELQQAAELQQAIELEGRRFMGLQLLDLKNRSLSSFAPASINSPTFTVTAPQSISNADCGCSDSTTSSCSSSREESPTEDKSLGDAAAPETKVTKVNSYRGPLLHHKLSDKEESVADPSLNEDSDFQPSLEHNLPDNPFASATKSFFTLDLFPSDEDMTTFSITSSGSNNNQLIGSTLLPATDVPSFSSHFFQMPRFSSGHGALGM